MAEAIICDVCTTTCKPADAMHVRLHRLSSATKYMTSPTKTGDVCNKCYKKLVKFLGGNDDAISVHLEATTEC